MTTDQPYDRVDDKTKKIKNMGSLLFLGIII
jgi:hypothetical protein